MLTKYCTNIQNTLLIYLHAYLEDETNVIKQKSLSSSLMVSDLVDETIKFLRDDSSETCVIMNLF